MSDVNRVVAVFDFDGTLVRGDSFITMALLAKGRLGLLRAMLRSFPKLAAWKLGLGSNSAAKETLFFNLFGGMSEADFNAYCDRLPELLTPIGFAVDRLRWHLSKGHRVYIISASIRNWVAPWAEFHGVSRVLATEAEVAGSRLTGRFATPNCYGPEKLRRLLEVEPRRENYKLFIYGDSAGDDALMAEADEATLIGQ